MSTGLRRFVNRGAAGPAPSAVAAPTAPTAPVGERCELCREPLNAWHGHLVDVQQRSIGCACRACYLLFTQDGAGGGRYRAIPERYRNDPSRPLTEADWADLGIPVDTAFFFTNSTLDRVLACYPSPAGATECLLDLSGWERVAAAHPLLRAVAADVEALFVTRTERGRESFLVPIDACYGLVGELRTLWRGFDGGEEVRAALAAFIDTARTRSRPIEPEA
jgi:hypothetical protein